jgi:hypothetical protein
MKAVSLYLRNTESVSMLKGKRERENFTSHVPYILRT